MRTKWWCTLVMTGLAAAWSAPIEKPAKLTLENLRGKWKLVEAKKNGVNATAEETKNVSLLIAGDQLTIDEGGRKTVARITIDPTKTPPFIDISITDEKVELRGIYELDKDTLKICFTMDGKDKRPTKFASTKEDETGLLILQREK